MVPTLSTILMSVCTLSIVLCYHECLCGPSNETLGSGAAASGGDSSTSEGSGTMEPTTDMQNECEQRPRPCHTNAECVNTDEGYFCECLLGYTGNGTYCTEIDAFETCESDPHPCDENARCTNTEDGVYCECNNGFQGNGLQCTDIDECSSQSDNCHRSASCVNKMGGYDCDCIFGYKGNGTHCSQHSVQIIAFSVGTLGGLLLLAAVILLDIYICRKFIKIRRNKDRYHYRKQTGSGFFKQRRVGGRTEQETSTVIYNPGAPEVLDMQHPQPVETAVQSVEIEFDTYKTDNEDMWHHAMKINEWPT